jgi:hypothetical protein
MRKAVLEKIPYSLLNLGPVRSPELWIRINAIND